jgi:hypothetical protein
MIDQFFCKKDLDEIKRLKMNFKPDKEWEGRGDIGLMSEIMANSMYWQSA